jgi:AcrR family transcriptional regulator
VPATGGEPVVRRRRRGMELQDAIHQAVLGELQEHGYAALSMDGVASRAQTGKATLYRRWPSKLGLVVDAFKHSAPDTKPPADSGDLREELLAVLRHEADSLDGASGAAARGLMAELVRTPELARVVRPFLADPFLAPMMEDPCRKAAPLPCPEGDRHGLGTVQHLEFRSVPVATTHECAVKAATVLFA